jgi:prepilin-type processing-associated H-X9-DG protein
VEYAFPSPVPIHLSPSLIAISAIAIFFVWLTRLAVPPRRPVVFRAALLVAVGIAVFVFVIAAGDVVFESLGGSHYPTRPLAVWIVLAVVTIGASFVKFRARVDQPLRITVSLVALIAIGLTLLGTRNDPARPAAQLKKCKDHLKSVGDAFVSLARNRGQFPPAIEHNLHQPPLSWRVALLPAIARTVTVTYDATQPWDSATNLPAAQSEVESYSCPAVELPRDEQNRWLTPYVLVTGPGTIFPGDKPVAIKDITDGLSNTLLSVEAIGLGIVWSEPRDFDVARDPLGFNLPGKNPGRSPGLLSSYHPEGANVVFADGSVRTLSAQTDPQVLKALTTAAGHESISESHK